MALPATGYSVQQNGTRFRIEVREGDRVASDSATVERAEVILGTPAIRRFPFQTSLWFAGTLTAYAANTSAWCLFAQLRHTEDAGDFASASPPFAIGSNANGELTISTRSSEADPLLVNPAELVRYTGPLTPGSPVNLVWNVCFDHRAAGVGFLKVWRDGVLVVNYTGPIGYNDAAGPYFKAGVYRATNPAPTVVQWANLEAGTADLSARITNPQP